MRELTRWSVCLLLLHVVTPAAAGAQQAPGTVPEEFLRAFVGADAVLLIGELPPDLERVIDSPEGARVIGSVVYENRSVAFVTVVVDADAALALFGNGLVADGWRTPEERPASRGFQRPEPAGVSRGFCGPAGEMLSISAGPGGDGTVVHLQYYAEFPGQLPCDRPSRPQRSDELEQRLPILNLLPGEFQRSTGRGGGLDSRWSGVELHSERTAAGIAEGLAEQLEAAGWVAGFAADSDDAALTTWTRAFEDGFEARGVLTVIELETGTYESLFRLTRMSPR